MRELILIRGLPGSGKSTMARLNYPGYRHYEADMYFYRDGQYRINLQKLPLAHAWCRLKTRMALARGHSVVVANTFIQCWELEPYLDMAEYFHVPVTILVARGNFGSIHGVPKEVVALMKLQWED